MKSAIKHLASLSAGLAVCLLPLPGVQAHHSFSAEFGNEPGELSGVITAVRFSNPHVRYQMDVQRDDGTVESWELQASSVTALRPQGWDRDTVEVGDSVRVQGELGRNDARKLFVRTLVTADGTTLGRGASGSQDADPNAAVAGKDYGFGAIDAAYPVDITGYWNNRYKFRPTVDDLTPKPTPFTEEGRAVFERHGKYDDPVLRCLSYGLPRLFGNPYNMTIYDAGTHYLFLYVDHNSPRRVWMDGRAPGADTPATSNGFSVGHWEGDELVIETTHLLPGWLDGSGLPMSGEGTRIVERYSFAEDRLTMDRVMTIHDPYYTEPLTRVRGSARGENLDVDEQGACDPTTYYLDLYEAGLLEEYLKP